MEKDEYRRGRDVTREADPPEVRPRYRPVIPVVWGVGAVLFVVSLWFGLGPALAVVGVTHLFFAGLVRADVAALGRQGVEWGAWRHGWVVAALVLPFAAPAYYVASGRKLRETNERRGHGVETAT
jgi:hypothetical protein